MKKSLILAAFSVAALIFSYCEEEHTFKEGALIYKHKCATCHMDDGSGLVGLIPPVVSSDFLKNEIENLPCLIRKGQKGNIVVNGKTFGDQEMPPMPELTDVEITNVLNFLGHNFGNQLPTSTIFQTRKRLENCD